jgi:hypothetical protein
MDETCVNLRIMNKLAKKLKANRYIVYHIFIILTYYSMTQFKSLTVMYPYNSIAAGALQLASPEVRFLLDKTEGTPTGTHAHLTNHLVGDSLFLTYIMALLMTYRCGNVSIKRNTFAC